MCECAWVRSRDCKGGEVHFHHPSHRMCVHDSRGGQGVKECAHSRTNAQLHPHTLTHTHTQTHTHTHSSRLSSLSQSAKNVSHNVRGENGLQSKVWRCVHDRWVARLQSPQVSQPVREILQGRHMCAQQRGRENHHHHTVAHNPSETTLLLSANWEDHQLHALCTFKVMMCWKPGDLSTASSKRT